MYTHCHNGLYPCVYTPYTRISVHVRVCLLHALRKVLCRGHVCTFILQCACQQVVSVRTHPCMCPGAHREGGSVQSHMHVHLRVTCTMLVPGQAYTCTHADLMGHIQGIYAMSCACGRRVYTTCIGPQVNTCSMHGPGRTHVCSHHGNRCVHGRPEPCPQGPALEEGVGRAQGESCWCQDSDGGTDCVSSLWGPEPPGWLGPASSLQSTRGMSGSRGGPAFDKSCPAQQRVQGSEAVVL